MAVNFLKRSVDFVVDFQTRGNFQTVEHFPFEEL
jgi:hypothetical protein